MPSKHCGRWAVGGEEWAARRFARRAHGPGCHGKGAPTPLVGTKGAWAGEGEGPHLQAVVQRAAGRVQLQGVERHDAGRPPPVASSPVDLQHVVRERLAELELFAGCLGLRARGPVRRRRAAQRGESVPRGRSTRRRGPAAGRAERGMHLRRERSLDGETRCLRGRVRSRRKSGRLARKAARTSISGVEEQQRTATARFCGLRSSGWSTGRTRALHAPRTAAMPTTERRRTRFGNMGVEVARRVGTVRGLGRGAPWSPSEERGAAGSRIPSPSTDRGGTAADEPRRGATSMRHTPWGGAWPLHTAGGSNAASKIQISQRSFKLQP